MLQITWGILINSLKFSVISCPYYVGWADVLGALIKFSSVFTGYVPDARDPNSESPINL